jgi:rhodanese-related sulfurtransferase
MPVPQLTPAQAAERRGTAVLLDVREPEEVVEQSIPGARNIPLGQLPDRLAELDPAQPVLTVCRSGGRSQKAAALLEAAGFDVADVSGGITQWARDGQPVTPGR